MSKDIKAALLSALVCPGVGQIALKRYKRGWLLIILVVIALVILLWMVTQAANSIINEGLRDGFVDVNKLLDLSERYSRGGVDNTYYYVSFFVIIACWIYGIIDPFLFKD
jgi:hypothetical protein